MLARRLTPMRSKCVTTGGPHVKKTLITIMVLGILGAGVWLIKYAVAAPAKAAAWNLAAINGLTSRKTTEAELLTRKEFQTIERKCFQDICFYQMEAEKVFLNMLHQ